jgi:hypothetical protein
MDRSHSCQRWTVTCGFIGQVPWRGGEGRREPVGQTEKATANRVGTRADFDFDFSGRERPERRNAFRFVSFRWLAQKSFLREGGKEENATICMCTAGACLVAVGLCAASSTRSHPCAGRRNETARQ